MDDKPHPAENRDWMRDNLGRARRLVFYPNRLARARRYIDARRLDRQVRRRERRVSRNRKALWQDELPDMKQRVRSHPVVLVLDPATVCNLRCPFCPTGGGYGDFARELLQPDGFARIMDHLDVDLLEEAQLYNWGEPLLNPHLVSYIRFLTDHSIATQISTNLSHRDCSESSLADLVESGLGEMLVSVDGASQESYERYRIRGELARVVANMKRLAAVKRRLGSDKPKVVYKMLLNRYNQHEIEAARAIAEDCEAEFWPDDSFWCPDDVRTEWLVDNRDEAPTQGFTSAPDPNEVISTYCRQLWTTVVVSANGDVYPCCLLYEPEHAVGNLLKEDIWSIRNNDRMVNLRRFVSDRDADDPPFPNLCVKCTSRWCTVVDARRPVQLGAPVASA